MDSRKQAPHALLSCLATVFAVTIALVFLFAAVMKARNLGDFARVTSTITLVPAEWRTILPLAIPLIEVLLAWLILMPMTRVAGLAAALVTLLVFTAYLVWRVTDPFAPDCGCLGLFSLATDAHTSNKLALARNIVLLGLNAGALVLIRRHRAPGLLPAPSLSAHPLRAGFTLAELLVVIGIIGLLLSILLPALARARITARRVDCASQQREIARAMLGLASQSGYMPLTGEIWLPPNIPNVYGALPYALQDSRRERYHYQRDVLAGGGTLSRVGEQVVPLPLALLTYLDQSADEIRPLTESTEMLELYSGLRLFVCPDEGVREGVFAREQMIIHGTPIGDGWGTVWFPQSDYAFNEGVLGFNYDTRFSASRLRGAAARVNEPSQTVLFADAACHLRFGGLTTSLTPRLSEVRERVSLGDIFRQSPLVVSKVPFAEKRHGGTANVAFVDGHVENVRLVPEALDRVFLSLPRPSDPD